MVGDWLKLYRKIVDSSVFANADLLQLFVLCLVKAGYADRWIRMDGVVEPVRVLRGQFVTGRNALHRDLYKTCAKPTSSPSTVWRRLEMLQSLECVNIETNSRFSIVTVNNFDSYQSSISEVEQTFEPDLNRSCTAVEQELNRSCTQNKKAKNPKKVKNTWAKEGMAHIQVSEVADKAYEIFTGIGYTGNEGGNIWKIAAMRCLGRGSEKWVADAVFGVNNATDKPLDRAALFYTIVKRHAEEALGRPSALAELLANIRVEPELPKTAPNRRAPVASTVGLVLRAPPEKPRAKDPDEEIVSMADELKRLKQREGT